MYVAHLLIALQSVEVGIGVIIALILAAALLVPYLVREIQRGKRDLRQKPIGVGDTRPGRPDNPAPGQPDAQADPYEASARRG